MGFFSGGGMGGALSGGMLGGGLFGPAGTAYGSWSGYGGGNSVKNPAAGGGLIGTSQPGGGKPTMPEFESQIDPKTGLLKQPYVLGNNLNTQYMDRLREIGLRDPGQQSEWRKVMEQKALADASRMGSLAGQAGEASMDRLAMRGGLSAGAAERMGNQTALNSLKAQQQALGARRGYDIQDELNRLSALNNLGAQERATAGYGQGVDQFNIANALGDVTAARDYALKKYAEDMRAYAAERVAAATPESTSGGLWDYINPF